jgi:hypothetical protein
VKRGSALPETQPVMQHWNQHESPPLW